MSHKFCNVEYTSYDIWNYNLRNTDDGSIRYVWYE